MNKFITTAKNTLVKATIFGAPVLALATTTAFASGDSLPTIAITTDMLKPIIDGIVANVGVVLPVGLALFSIGLGIRIIPGLISRFLHM